MARDLREEMSDKPKRRCPTCKKELDAKINQALLPFCSKKCKMADLGKWFFEEYSIPSNNDIVTEEDILASNNDSK